MKTERQNVEQFIELTENKIQNNVFDHFFFLSFFHFILIFSYSSVVDIIVSGKDLYRFNLMLERKM